MRTHIAGIPATISRTGFTGDLGYEIWLEPQQAEKLWDVLMEVGERYRLRAAGNLALDMARIEAGLLLVAVDFMKPARIARPEGLSHFDRWYQEVSARPSARA